MKVYVLIMTVNSATAFGLGAWSTEEKAKAALEEEIKTYIDEGYEITTEEGKGSFMDNSIIHYVLDKPNDVSADTLEYELEEMEMG